MTTAPSTEMDLTVIIPTAGYSSRGESIFRAIESVLSLEGVRAKPCVVLNGVNYAEELRSKLETHEEIDFHYIPEGDLTKAIYFGRQCVRTPYFSFLDDDDEYTSSAFVNRFKQMELDQGVDVAVANGYRASVTGVRHLIFKDFTRNAECPLSGLTRGNWLASCGGMYRSRTVREDYFVDISKYFEWTWLAIRLSLECSVSFFDEPAFVVNDTADSLSKSASYELKEVDFLLRVLNEVPVPGFFKRHLRRKLAAKHIGFANRALANGQRVAALRHYVNCLMVGRAGLPYLLWARKVLLP